MLPVIHRVTRDHSAELCTLRLTFVSGCFANPRCGAVSGCRPGCRPSGKGTPDADTVGKTAVVHHGPGASPKSHKDRAEKRPQDDEPSIGKYRVDEKTAFSPSSEVAPAKCESRPAHELVFFLIFKITKRLKSLCKARTKKKGTLTRKVHVHGMIHLHTTSIATWAKPGISTNLSETRSEQFLCDT